MTNFIYMQSRVYRLIPGSYIYTFPPVAGRWPERGSAPGTDNSKKADARRINRTDDGTAA
jgi:hypothetical protein